MLLSILIPTMNSRASLLTRLMAILEPQLTDQIEVLTDADDGELPIGTKRNHLMQRAKGKYVCYVDDDDRVSEDYISTLMEGIEKDVDVVCIQGIMTTNGMDPYRFVDTPYMAPGMASKDGEYYYTRGVQHLDATRREIALYGKFIDSSYGEDDDWTKKIESTKLVQSWHLVDHPTYFYDYRFPKDREIEPKFAVVMPCWNHVYTTTKSVESLFENTADKNFCLVLVDDGSTDDTRDYARDLGVRFGFRRFHYHRNRENLGVNASWNAGIAIARARGAEYIAVVNNDVLFAPNWDASLIESLRDPKVGVISPLSTYGAVPLDWPRGAERNMNPAGYMGYMPILGACFAFRSKLIDEIGPFPEELRIYFGDNWIALAAQNKGYECGYDDKSYVHHFFCITTAALNNGPIWERESPIWERISKPLGELIPAVPKEEAGHEFALTVGA
jgi:GT2 family glycosyltransferase